MRALRCNDTIIWPSTTLNHDTMRYVQYFLNGTIAVNSGCGKAPSIFRIEWVHQFITINVFIFPRKLRAVYDLSTTAV